MTTLIHKATSTLSTIALFAIGSAIAVLGFAMIGVLALFALATVGLAFLAAPFLGQVQPADDTDETAATAA